METIATRFRRLLPVVVDVETSGLDPKQHGMLELAAISLKMDDIGMLSLDQTYHYHIALFEGAKCDPESLKITKIIPDHPFRFAISEKEALTSLFSHLKKESHQKRCERAILVAHNAWFDLHFINAAIERNKLKSGFHRFTSFDTATLSGFLFGETVLIKALNAAKISFDSKQAHSALYDATKTAELFCYMVNEWKKKGLAYSQPLP